MDPVIITLLIQEYVLMHQLIFYDMTDLVFPNIEEPNFAPVRSDLLEAFQMFQVIRGKSFDVALLILKRQKFLWSYKNLLAHK